MFQPSVPRYMQSSKLIISKRGSVYFNCNAKIPNPSEPVKIHPKQFEELLTKCREEMNATRIARSTTGIGKFLILLNTTGVHWCTTLLPGSSSEEETEAGGERGGFHLFELHLASFGSGLG